MHRSEELEVPQFEMPASAAQEFLWQDSRQSSAAWNVAVRFRLRGHLDAGGLEAAINQVIARHEILRTTAVFSDGLILQRIAGALAIQLLHIDLSQSLQQQADLEAVSKTEAQHLFDLSSGPLLRAALAELAETEHILLLTLHHSICDGWSIGTIVPEIMSAYARSSQDREPALQYADFAISHNEYRDGEGYRAHGRFWREQLKGASSVPAAHPARSNSGDAAAILSSFVLPRTLTDDLAAIAKQERLTFFEVALSAFALTRAICAGRNDAVFATAVSGRTSPEMESIVGPFVNYLPVTIACEPSASLSGFLHRVADRMELLTAHSDYRYEDMLADPNIGSACFDHIFICQRDFVPSLVSGDLELIAIPSVSPGALHAMTFFMVERADGWRISCEVDPAVYSAWRAQQTLSIFAQVLAAFVDTKNATIADTIAQLVVPTTEERSAEIIEMPASEAQTRYWLLEQVQTDASSLHLRIRLRIQGTFDAALARQAFQLLINKHEILRTTFISGEDGLRQRIHPLGAGPDITIRTLSDLPEEIKGSVVDDLLTREDGHSFSNEGASLLRALILETGPSEAFLAITLPHIIADGWSCGILLRDFCAGYDTLARHQSPALEAPAIQYADYAVSEREWLGSDDMKARQSWWTKYLDTALTPLDLPSDASSMGAAAGDARGGIETIELNPAVTEAARRLAREYQVTLFSIYGAVFHALLWQYTRQSNICFTTPFANRTVETEEVMGPFAAPVLICCAAHPGANLKDWASALQENSMAAFENAIPLEQYSQFASLQSRRGRHALNQVSFYLQNAFVSQLSAAGFTATPLPSSVTGAAFEWQLAIIDYGGQVKAEFQYDAGLWSAASIRMVLDHFTHLLEAAIADPQKPLDDLPIATNGEAGLQESPDRLLPISRRLLHLEAAGVHAGSGSLEAAPSPANEDGYVGPTTELERTLTSIWQRVFHRSAIGIRDNFFDIGGHSLTLARLQAQIKKALGHRIVAADIFAAPTIEALAKRISGSQEGVGQSRIVPLREGGKQPPLFLVSQSMVFRRTVQWLDPDQPVYTVVMQDEDLKNGVLTSFEEIAAYYVSLIRSIRPYGPYRLGGWCVSAWLAYEIAQQLRRAGESVDLLLLVDAWAPGYWRSIGRGKRMAAKADYYAARIKLHSQALMPMPFRKKVSFLTEKCRLMRAAAARQIASFLFRKGLKVEIKVESQTALMEQVLYSASRNYNAERGDYRALVFRSAEQPRGKFLPQDLGWSELLEQRVEAISLPGDHRQIFEDPGAKILAGSIASALGLEKVAPAALANAEIAQTKNQRPNQRTACAVANTNL
jgi:thioesterase domain-containing protein/NRPS condensation-like uncharacterized protein